MNRCRPPSFVVALVGLLASPLAIAATSAGVATSPLSGNGHNVTFDGRLFVVARAEGWVALVLRPELVDRNGAFPDVGAAFSEPALIQPTANCENALALCEANADDTPYACDESGARGGPFACYDLVVIDSNACGTAPNVLRSRHLRVWVAEPGSAGARPHKHEWQGDITPLATTTASSLRGIEPTVTRDGRLLVWQGHPQNDGQIDVLMYANNTEACGVSGWRGPFNLSHMVNDPVVNTTYRLAERTLRAADGTPYADGARVRGAYPWIFPDGSALNFTSVNMPCRAENDPVGCGPRRSGLAVMGYPTNWALAHIDGPVNPATDDTVRLFFSSPGPTTLRPHTPGVDVWPFFGSNTSNYTEIVFDDGLDGRYAGVWHMNESVTDTGTLDRTRTPDTSGYFNTGLVQDAAFPARNEGPRGKTLVFNGTSAHVRVPHDVSLEPVNGITVELTLRPDAPVDCDGNNNWRTLVDKGGVGVGVYSLVLEEGQNLQARVRVEGGVQRSVWANTSLPVGEWSDIAFTYDAATGHMGFFVNGIETGAADYPPALLDHGNADLFFGGPGGNHPACPDGNGGFFGQLEEVRISRFDRLHAPPAIGEGEGEGESEGGEGEGEGDGGSEGEGEGGSEGEGESGNDTNGSDGDGDEGVETAPVNDEANDRNNGSGRADGCAAAPAAPSILLGVPLGIAAFRRRRRC